MENLNYNINKVDNFDVQVNNICITSADRENYKYVVAREVGYEDTKLWFYCFANSLQQASRVCREIGNGIIIETRYVK